MNTLAAWRLIAGGVRTLKQASAEPQSEVNI